MDAGDLLPVRNGKPFDRPACRPASIDQFRNTVIHNVNSGSRLCALFVEPGNGNQDKRLTAVLGDPASGMLGIVTHNVGNTYPSLTPSCPAAHWFEREIAEQSGVIPEGHPWLKPVRFIDEKATVGVTGFFHMDGEEVHEVAVGPVHAGVIEPGHFRFQCHGETVHHLEISLGYQHRGVEKAIAAGPNKKSLHYAETLSGDTSIGHATGYCRIIEGLAELRLPPRVHALRAIAAELERIANHVGDLGALAGDVGFLPTMSYCGRIRGDVLNMTAQLCGNRFGRGYIIPGGVAYDVDASLAAELIRRLDAIERDSTGAIELMFSVPSVISRFEGTGALSEKLAREIGLVGVAARACGITCDCRDDIPYGYYKTKQIPVSTWATGDCYARAYVRWLEIKESITFIRELLHTMPEGPPQVEVPPLKPNTGTVTLTEGWRGEICHAAATDSAGRFAFYKIVDPSFHNWFGLAYALREQAISDFPLCNKSFNLSYCGHDL